MTGEPKAGPAEADAPAAAAVPARSPTLRSRRALLVVPLAVFACLALLFGLRLRSGADPSVVPSALIGQAVPSAALPPLAGLLRDGAPVPGWSGAELMGGRGVTVVNVWASWCAPCQEEHPVLMELPGRMPGLRLVGLNYKDQPENARRFLGAFGDPFAAVGVDPNGTVAIDWGVYGVPETFVVGPDGRVRFKQVGPLKPETLPAFLEEVRKAAGG